MSDIIVLGSLNMDLVIKAKRTPEAGETIPGEAVSLQAQIEILQKGDLQWSR